MPRASRPTVSTTVASGASAMLAKSGRMREIGVPVRSSATKPNRAAAAGFTDATAARASIAISASATPLTMPRSRRSLVASTCESRLVSASSATTRNVVAMSTSARERYQPTL